MSAELFTWIGIISAVFYLPMTEDHPAWLRSGVKTLPLACFAVAAFVTGQGAYLVAGFLFSATGDFALSRRGASAFLYGLSAFALAHVLYLLHFLSLSRVPLWEAFVLNTPLAVFLVAYAVAAGVWLLPPSEPMRLPVRIYMVLIAAMGLAALTLPVGMIFVGVVLFIASDTLLALQLFRLSEDDPMHSRVGWVLWAAYIAAQLFFLSA